MGQQPLSCLHLHAGCPLSSMGKAWIWGTPRLLLLLLVALLPGTSLASPPEPQYLVLVPFVIHTEAPEKICVQLSHLNETVTLSATIEYGTLNSSLIQVVVAEEDIFQCVPFQLPKWSISASPAKAIVTVTVKGPTLKFRSQKTVLVRNLERLLFVQTDKPIYKAEEKVRFRIVCLDEAFRPVNQKVPLVYIQDPKRNRVFQWTNVELLGGIIQLSFPLSSEPILGTYKVVVERSSRNTIKHQFVVEEYVLPKYEVVIKAPDVISIVVPEFEVTVCGKYTYGKPVPGRVKINVCRVYVTTDVCKKNVRTLCEEYSGEADGHGCLSWLVETKAYHLKQGEFFKNLEVEGKITEEGTGVEMTHKSSTKITSIVSKLSFENMETYYKPGIPLFLQVKLLDWSNAPIAHEIIEITSTSINYRANYTTDEEGRVQCLIDTSNFTEGYISFKAVYKRSDSSDNEKATHFVTRFYSPSKSYVHIEPFPKTLSCGHPEQIPVHFFLDPQDVMGSKVVFHYLVISKGDIVQAGTEALLLKGKKDKRVFLLNLSVDVDAAPLARLLVYTILTSGELVAHSRNFTVEKGFSNKVKLWFSDPQDLPGSETQLHLAASPGSLCAVHAVDQSIFLLRPEAELSAEKVYNLLPVTDGRGYYYSGHYLNERESEPCIFTLSMEEHGVHYHPELFHFAEDDVYDVLKELGLKVFTSTKMHKPNICFPIAKVVKGDLPSDCNTPHFPVPLIKNLQGPPGVLGSPGPIKNISPSDAVTETVRKFFPETFLWELLLINEPEDVGRAGEGSREIAVPVTIPDTITEWKAGAFCLSADTGFGLAQPALLKAFQPFFLELTLPYSVVRGESFPLKATVFSYLPYCIRVSIFLSPSSDFVVSPVEKEEESYCLCANGRKTVSWMVTPKSLGDVNFTASAEALSSDQLCGNEVVKTPSKGQKDVVIRSLLVEPEGIEKETVFNLFLCAHGDPQSSSVSLKVPENVVEDSARATFCVLGDILGGAITNLHQLLKMPYGCGEQNMALFAPNIYILNYLNKTGQLTEEIRSKASGYLVAGYQRQLNFKHMDGSYSAFGESRSPEGNTWLTAFVLKSFAQARPYLYVEERHITDAQTSLAIRQMDNGCFKSTGYLVHNDLKGGVDNHVTLSIYITIALLEVPLPLIHPLVQNALFCLETAAQNKEIHVYTRALLAYGFALAGKEDKRQQMLDALQKEAVKEEDGSIHWQRPGKQEKRSDDPYDHYARAASAEVEMTSYVLLAYVTKQPAPSLEDLTTAFTIVRWLIKQQNPSGGFSSTQDTVVALQALSQYRIATYSKEGVGARVALSSGGAILTEFHVDGTNSLLLQCQALPQVPGVYETEVTGCIFMQTTLRYNIQLQKEAAPFRLDVHTVPDTCTGPKAHRTFDVAVNVSYTGQRLVSNMAIVDVKMLSGYIPVKSTIRMLERLPHVQRTEISTTHVLLYLDQVSITTQSYSFAVELETPVQGLKPTLVKIYDYYETDDFATSEYNAPCHTDNAKETHNA